ncbi:hypothetical protein [Streptomyces akebiae]|nr:hypothetical protein [Streptomyces akebiae]
MAEAAGFSVNAVPAGDTVHSCFPAEEDLSRAFREENGSPSSP